MFKYIKNTLLYLFIKLHWLHISVQCPLYKHKTSKYCYLYTYAGVQSTHRKHYINAFHSHTLYILALWKLHIPNLHLFCKLQLSSLHNF